MTVAREVKRWVVVLILRFVYCIQVLLTGITYAPKCPWCGAECSTEMDEAAYDGDLEEMTCDECGKDYARYTSFMPEFWTEKTEP